MEWFADNWPALLVILAVLLVVMGLLRRLIRLAFFGVALGAIGLVLWPYIASGGT